MANNKNAFWQAFVIASLIFWLGVLIGVYFENSRAENVRDFYFDIETDIFDFELSSDIVYNFNLDCEKLNDQSIIFADNIYWEAKKLEKYDNSNKLTSEMVSLHRRYDLLRTILWEKIIEKKKVCVNKVNTVIYLYQYDDPSLTAKATQDTMSNFLLDLKENYGDKIVLIPIAVDTNVESLKILRDYYGLNFVPMIFVNEKYKFETINSLEDIKESLF